MGNRNNNNNTNGLGVDLSSAGALILANSLNEKLNQAGNQSLQTHYPQPIQQTYTVPSTPMTVEQAYAQPVEVRYVNRPPLKPSVPDIDVPYTSVWKASRLHPQNQWRYVWYPYYTIVEYAKSPVGVFLIVVSILLSGLNFLLNGSYQGPGYAAGKAIPVVPTDMPKFATPVVDVIE